MPAGGYHPRAYPWGQVKAENRPARVRERVGLQDVDALVALLRFDCQERRGVGEATIRTYSVGARAFLEWCFSKGVDLLSPHADVSLDWTRFLEKHGASPQTILTYRPAVTALYRALRWAGATTADPMKDAPRVLDPVPRHEKRLPYGEGEFRKLLGVATPDERVLLLLTGLAGLRNAEVRAARWSDVDWPSRTLVVKGKRGRVRRVHLARSLVDALQVVRGTLDARARPEFLIPWSDPDTVRGHLKRVCAAAGVPYEGRALHGLRHTSGTLLYQRTRNLDDVARHLGHSQIETSRVYAEHENSATREALDDFSEG